MRIFEFHWKSVDDKEWIYAPNIIHAIKHLCDLNAETFEEHFPEEDDDVEITEIPKEKWSGMKVQNTEYDENDPEDWEEMTFEEFVKDLPDGFTDYIAGTMHV